MPSADSLPQSGVTLEWSGLSDVGRRRTNNEDSWGAWSLGAAAATPLSAGPLALPPRGVLLAVSDGMGGAAGGEVASHLCIEQLGPRVGALAPGADPLEGLQEVFLAIHAALGAAAEATPPLRGMGATLSAVWLRPEGRGFIAHVGDSRIYHAPAGGDWVQLTEDQSVGAAMVRRGEMTAEAVRRLRYRSMLEQVMGGDGAPIEPQLLEFAWGSGSRLALCSDGLHGPLEDILPGRLTEAFAGTVTEGNQGLIDAANAAGGPDNVTVVLARFVPGRVS